MQKISCVATHIGLMLLAGVLVILTPAFAGNDAKAKAKYFEAEEQLNRGDATGAISSLEETIDLLGSTNPRIQVLLVKACKLAGLQDRALTELKTFFRIVPSDAQGSADYDEMSKLQTELTTTKENPRESKCNRVGFSLSRDEVFTACGKKWKVWKNDVNWNETQSWINSLGGGWRTPSKGELHDLYNEFGKGPCIVWAESKDSSSAWNFNGLFGCEAWALPDVHSYLTWAVAVYDKKFKRQTERTTTKENASEPNSNGDVLSLSPGKAFTACGKVWKVWENDVDWDKAQSWINSLGDGWRTPERAELHELCNTLGKSKVYSGTWAESRDSTTAWYFYFYDGNEKWTNKNFHMNYNWAVAVRSQ